MPELLTIRDTAGVLRMSAPTIRLWIYQGKLPVVKFGRKCLFRRTDLESFIERNVRPAVGESNGR